MVSFKRKPKSKGKTSLTRKDLRKQKRNEKKVRKNEYFTKGKKEKNKTNNLSGSDFQNVKAQKRQDEPNRLKLTLSDKIQKTTKVLSTEEQRKKEKNMQKQVEKAMQKQRKEQLIQANIEEDKTIKKIEKQLKLHKRKSKTLPKSFALDGLDYLLEVCDSEGMSAAVAAEKEFSNVNDEFKEDFALMTEKSSQRKKSKTAKSNTKKDVEDNYMDDSDQDQDLDALSDEAWSSGEEESESSESIDDDNSSEIIHNNEEEVEYFLDDLDNISENSNILKHSSQTRKRKNEVEIEDSTKSKKIKKREKDAVQFGKLKKEETCDEYDNSENDLEDFDQPDSLENEMEDSEKSDNSENENEDSDKSENGSDNSQKNDQGENEELEDDSDNSEDLDLEESKDCASKSLNIKGANRVNADGTWEDIYGRLRTPDGSIIAKKEKQAKYVPPAVRAKLEASKDTMRLEKLNRLKKQLKGLLNRLAESNMHSIATQIENLYMNNSRNDMNETITTLLFESLVSPVITPERLLMEHVLLIVILHANIGSEVGAHFLQTVVKQFDTLSKANHEVENKMLDNTVNILCQLYNFKLFDSKLLYEVLNRLSFNFHEKDVECILHILRNVGFTLRKDDPIALKNLILSLQKQAATLSDTIQDNARIKFMLDILMAIKNNNVTKIPNYDTTYSEHLKKIMKGFIRKGNYVTQLNISLDDLLKAEEKGKWWVVGSAWTGSVSGNETKKTEKTDEFSSKLLELARKQRMNTDTRRNIFCILMSAEDYLDAFEKLLRLGLKNQQEREYINVILHCCLQEKNYNPYYAILAQKFCEYDRKYQIIIKCSIWDKLKTLGSHSGSQISNMAKLLTHLFVEKGLPISTLKVVQFSELDKITLRFMRQILLGVLLHKNIEAVQEVFKKVALSDKLKMFRESIRLFIHHFLLRNLKTGSIPEDQKSLLEQRAKIVEKILVAKESRVRF